ncbi:MAG: hypothetical protein HY392_01700 [Candidatus Diapherotrites archaeon]|nr:hypothetical protein [Candidatus Diapherotrites archaeon]
MAVMQEEPQRAMFDTSVYKLLLEGRLVRIKELVKSSKLIVYGCKVVRDELRETSPSYKFNGKSLRNLLIFTYDSLVGKRSYPVGNEIEALAKEYLDAYAGGVSKYKLFNDFKIVATATAHRLDVVISEDDRTMKSIHARKAYSLVNQSKMYETPEFKSVKDL